MLIHRIWGVKKYKEKKKTTPIGFSAQVNGTMELLLIKKGKPIGGAGPGQVRSWVLAIESLRCP